MSNVELIIERFSNLQFDKSPIIIITGPTGIGKSSLALSLAKKIDGIIINADSMQIYKELKILSSQPIEEDKKFISHYLYGIRSIVEKFSVMEWLGLVNETLNIVSVKKKIPILVGGTGLYIRSAIEGVSKIPIINNKFLEKSKRLFNTVGILEFRKIVRKIDSDFVIKNIDKHRLIRAHSVFLQTGINISKWHKNSERFNLSNNYFCILLEQEREKIYENCEKRFDDFIYKGAVDEVQLLIEKNFDRSLPGFKCLGVIWILKYLEKKISLQDAILLSKRDTRRYVKRQLTWLRHNFNPDLIIQT